MSRPLIWVWRCHGHQWELVPSRRYPERNDYQPICPDCGGRPKRKWVLVDKT